MKKVFLFILAAATLVIAGCNKENGNQDVNTAELTALVAQCQTVLAAATTADYPQEAITEFQTVVNAAATALAGTPTQAQVTNLVAQLKAALATFEGKAYGAIPAAALTFALSFDEGAGSSLTTSGSNAWTAKLVAGPSQIFETTALPTFVDGKVGKAMHFANGSHLEIADYSAPAVEGNALSIAVWAKPDETFANNYIISYNYWNTWKLQVQDAGKPFATVNVNGCIDMDNENDNSVPANSWTHIVFTYNSTGNACFYVNGELTKEWTKDTKGNLEGALKHWVPESGNALPICIGACTTIEEAMTWSWFNTNPADWGHFKGTLDELRVYNVALTAGQVSKLYRDQK